MLEVMAWLGSFSLAICGAPIAIDSIKNGHSNGVNWNFICLWLFGEVCLFVYVVSLLDVILIFNYGLNIILISIIIWYRFFPRRNSNEQ